ncbi:GNAT family N-acetyltransferase [Flavisphingomonas formosensis]|uniref:GNAT family N-acetyltransferase n=1 Tax=Flavisphingomonas formosensis TaxID=861534 RepID=UPI0012F7724F|nr:GNAT family N-acetyltransferase [Sphingomonas formosensis]
MSECDSPITPPALPPGYCLSDDPADMQIDVIHGYLARSYWSPGVPRERVERAIAGSLVIGVFRGTVQVGFARLITDRTTFAYLADVFVLEEEQGRGLARAMLHHLQSRPDLQGLRRWMLATHDAHSLYASLGWTPLANPEWFMQRS